MGKGGLQCDRGVKAPGSARRGHESDGNCRALSGQVLNHGVVRFSTAVSAQYRARLFEIVKTQGSSVQNTLFSRNKYRIHPIYAVNVTPYHMIQLENSIPGLNSMKAAFGRSGTQ